jgi:hypothetical protein
MKLPYELIDFIILQTDNINLVFKFEKILSRSSKKFLLRKVSFDKEAENGNLKMLKLLYSIGITGESEAINWAAARGHLEVVKFLCSIGAPGTKYVMYYAAGCGHLEIVKFLHSIGIPGTYNAMENASQGGFLEVVKFLRSIGTPKTSNGHPEAVLFLCSPDTIES